MRVPNVSPPAHEAPGFESLQQAAQWFAVLCSDEATEADRSGWRTWLDQRRENRDAWQYVENVTRQFEPLQSQADRKAAGKALKAAGRPAASRRRALGMLAAIPGAGLLGWAVVQETPLRKKILALRAGYRTGIGEIREFMLADGTRIWLNTSTALNADYRHSLRRVELLLGEVLIETAGDAARPFVVDTDFGRLTARGTRFVVRHHDDHAYLAVYEGRVEISTVEGGRSLVLDAGQQVTFARDAIASPTPADRARQAWARGVLVADNIPLGDLIAELARYRAGYLGCSPEVAGLRVMGTYPLTDPDRVLALLQEALPVRVRRTLPWWVTVGALN